MPVGPCWPHCRGGSRSSYGPCAVGLLEIELADIASDGHAVSAAGVDLPLTQVKVALAGDVAPDEQPALRWRARSRIVLLHGVLSGVRPLPDRMRGGRLTSGVFGLA